MIKDVKAYVYKYKFLWIGWVVVNNEDPPIFYYDNTPTIILEPESKIGYCTFGLTKKGVIRRLEKSIMTLFHCLL